MMPRPTPSPSPAALAARAATRSAEPGDPSAHPGVARVREILDEAAGVREAASGEFDLAALSRQVELLTLAHDTLAEALED